MLYITRGPRTRMTLTTDTKEAIVTRDGYTREEVSNAFTLATGRVFKLGARWHSVNQRRRYRSFDTKAEAMRWASGSR